ncbi:hypothetical protein BU15DRAFT_65928 [Melanogaster broomeanus]|nr:hypothetical protein BU15DRAFT_65928 [Melanogaster broomeanus]
MPRIYTPDGTEKPTIIPVDAHLDDLVVKWNAAGHNEGGVILDFARRYDKNAVLMDGNAALRFVFAKFIAVIRKGKVGEEDEMYVFRDVEDKTRRGTSLCGLAHVLVTSTFFKTLPSHLQPTPFSVEEIIWLHKLRRRLWRVAHYALDASILLRTGLKFFATVLGAEGLKSFFEGDGGFHIEWVGRQPGIVHDGHGRPYYRPKSLISRFDELLAEEVDKIEIGVDDHEKLLKDMDFRGALEQVWKAENAIIPYLHCELQLIHYLERNDIAVHKSAIGVNKLTCFACNAYVGAVNARRDLAGLEPWVLPGTSNKFDPAWLIPQSTEGIQAVNLIWERLKKGIQDLARRELRWKRVKGYGSNIATVPSLYHPMYYVSSLHFGPIRPRIWSAMAIGYNCRLTSKPLDVETPSTVDERLQPLIPQYGCEAFEALLDNLSKRASNASQLRRRPMNNAPLCIIASKLLQPKKLFNAERKWQTSAATVEFQAPTTQRNAEPSIPGIAIAIARIAHLWIPQSREKAELYLLDHLLRHHPPIQLPHGFPISAGRELQCSVLALQSSSSGARKMKLLASDSSQTRPKMRKKPGRKKEVSGVSKKDYFQQLAKQIFVNFERETGKSESSVVVFVFARSTTRSTNKLGQTGAGMSYEDLVADPTKSNIIQKLVDSFPWWPDLHGWWRKKPAYNNSSAGFIADFWPDRRNHESICGSGTWVELGWDVWVSIIWRHCVRGGVSFFSRCFMVLVGSSTANPPVLYQCICLRVRGSYHYKWFVTMVATRWGKGLLSLLFAHFVTWGTMITDPAVLWMGALASQALQLQLLDLVLVWIVGFGQWSVKQGSVPGEWYEYLIEVFPISLFRKFFVLLTLSKFLDASCLTLIAGLSRTFGYLMRFVLCVGYIRVGELSGRKKYDLMERMHSRVIKRWVDRYVL